jgi:hypothetical protein
LVVTEMKYTEAPKISKRKETPNKPAEVIDVKAEVPDIKAEMQVASTVTKKDIMPLVPKSLLESLVACNTSIELGTILEKEKLNNTLIYSISEAFRKINSSEKFYIVLIDPNTKKIVSFFDKGNSERKDLKYGKKFINIENDAKNLIQLWIQLF